MHAVGEQLRIGCRRSAFVYQPETDRTFVRERSFLRYEGRLKNERALISYRYQAREKIANRVPTSSIAAGKSEAWPRLLRIEESAAVQAFPAEDGNRGSTNELPPPWKEWLSFATAWIKSKLGLRQFSRARTSESANGDAMACLTYNPAALDPLEKRYATAAS